MIWLYLLTGVIALGLLVSVLDLFLTLHAQHHPLAAVVSQLPTGWLFACVLALEESTATRGVVFTLAFVESVGAAVSAIAAQRARRRVRKARNAQQLRVERRGYQ